MTEQPGLTPADLAALGELTFELIGGDLYIGGVNHGHGPHARTLLQLLQTPPERSQPAPSDDGDEADGIDAWALQRLRRHAERSDGLLGELLRFLVRADPTAFARIYAVMKVEQAAMDARYIADMQQLRASRRATPAETKGSDG